MKVVEIAIIAVSYLLTKSLTYKYVNPEAVFMCGWVAGAIVQNIIEEFKDD